MVMNRILITLFSLCISINAMAEAARYVGDQTCQTCHRSIYKDYANSGHPYKLQKVNGQAPRYPKGTSPGVPQPPLDKSWKELSYVIGGYGWKARFMDSEGYILTGTENRQYNLPNPHLNTPETWTGYDAKYGERKPYTCGECHTTGWIATGKDGPHQDNLPGIYGTWAQPGITCEACHGAGSRHADTPTRENLSTEERCGDCHKRGDVRQIDASGGLIKHHEQYEDLLASPHKYLKCGACHDPHKSVKYALGGIKDEKTTCLQCHENQTVKLKNNVHQQTCTTCHMPRVAKSAVQVTHTVDGYPLPEGDIRGHLFRISTDADWDMFTSDGQFVEVDDQHKAYLTVDRACLTCHQDRSRDWALEYARKVH